MKITTKRLSDAIERLDRITKIMQENKTTHIDEIELGWASDEDLINLALDYERVTELDKETMESVIYVLGKRLEGKIFTHEDT